MGLHSYPKHKARLRTAKKRESLASSSTTIRLAANGVWRWRSTRRRPCPAPAPGGGPYGGVPWRRIPPPLRGLLRRRPLPPRPLRRQSEEVRVAVRRLRWGGELRVQALQGEGHGRVVPDVRPGVYQPVPLPDL